MTDPTPTTREPLTLPRDHDALERRVVELEARLDRIERHVVIDPDEDES